MHFQNRVLFVLAICFIAFAGHSQSPAWKTVRYGQLILHYPPTWQADKVSEGGHTFASITPDSMKNLSMRIIRISELPKSADHTYNSFKKAFTSILQAGVDSQTKILKTEETSFKGHKTMYGEIVESSLPVKVYGIDAGKNIYIIALFQRRYSNIPEPKMEKDEMEILNAIVIE